MEKCRFSIFPCAERNHSSDLLEENNLHAAQYPDGSHEELFQGRQRQVIVRTVGYTGWKLVGVVPLNMRGGKMQVLDLSLRGEEPLLPLRGNAVFQGGKRGNRNQLPLLRKNRNRHQHVRSR